LISDHAEHKQWVTERQPFRLGSLRNMRYLRLDRSGSDMHRAMPTSA